MPPNITQHRSHKDALWRSPCLYRLFTCSINMKGPLLACIPIEANWTSPSSVFRLRFKKLEENLGAFQIWLGHRYGFSGAAPKPNSTCSPTSQDGHSGGCSLRGIAILERECPVSASRTTVLLGGTVLDAKNTRATMENRIACTRSHLCPRVVVRHNLAVGENLHHDLRAFRGNPG